MTKSSTYWDNRALQRLSDAEKTSEAYIKRIQKIYEQAHKDVQREIDRIYRNYSKATGLDIQKLKELLSKKETDKVWKTLQRQGLDKYVKNNYKSRISRLEQIQAQIYAKAKQIYPKEQLEQTMCYRGVINDSYYKAVYDTQMGTGYDFSFNKIDDNMLKSLLNERWSGANYSKRIWTNTDILAESLSQILGGGMLAGQSREKTSRQIRDRFNVSEYYAKRLVQTETNYFNNKADAMAYKEMGVKKYVFVATLDGRTSKMCQEHDGKVYNFKDKEVGVNYPPLHPNCRSKTRGYISEEVEKNLKRRARNPLTGENEVIDNINYKDWIKQYGIVDNKNNMFVTNKNVIYNTKSLGMLDGKLVETNAKQLDKLIDKYPKMGEYIKKRGLTYGGSNRSNAIAYTRYTRDLNEIGIYLEKDYCGKSSVYRKEITNAIKRGEFMPCSNKYIDKYALTHEFGHVVETYLMNEYNIANPLEYQEALTSNYKWDKYKDKVYNNIRQDIIGIAMKNNPSFDIDSQLSMYGKSTPAEFFAECFANMECGKSNELGKAMKKYLKGVM